MPDTESTEIIIQGLTSSGKAFRPSDWAERLCGVFSTFGKDHRMNYSPYVRPLTIDNVKSVVVEKRFQEIDPRSYNFLLSFAKDNGLLVIEGRRMSVR